MENTTNTKNDIKNIETKLQSKNKNKGQNKQKVRRDITALEKSAEALKSLEASTITEDVQDRNLIQHNLKLIIELKEKGVGYEAIHQTLVKTAGLQISLATMKIYIRQQKVKMGLAEKRSKNSNMQTIRAHIRKECAEKVEELIRHINNGIHRVTCLGIDQVPTQESKPYWQINFDSMTVQNKNTPESADAVTVN